MANISDDINTIQTAVYGKDIRRAIASGIEDINTEVESTTTRQTNLENSFNQEMENAVSQNPASAETVAARTDNINNKTYDTLGLRLDGVSSQLAEKAAQSDLNVTNANVIANTNAITLKANQTDLNLTNSNVSLKADKIYVDTQIQSMNSTVQGFYTTVSALTTAFPSGNSNNYVVTADNYIYRWNGSVWANTGYLFNNTGIAPLSIDNGKVAPGAVSQDKLSFSTVEGIKSKNLFDKRTVTMNKFLNTGGGLSDSTGYSVSDYIYVTGNTQYTISKFWNVCFYDANKTFISVNSDTATFTTPSNCAFLRLTTMTVSDLNVQQLELGNVSTSYALFKNLVDEETLPDKVNKTIIKKPIYTFSNENIILETGEAMIGQCWLDSINTPLDPNGWKGFGATVLAQTGKSFNIIKIPLNYNRFYPPKVIRVTIIQNGNSVAQVDTPVNNLYTEKEDFYIILPSTFNLDVDTTFQFSQLDDEGNYRQVGFYTVATNISALSPNIPYSTNGINYPTTTAAGYYPIKFTLLNNVISDTSYISGVSPLKLPQRVKPFNFIIPNTINLIRGKSYNIYFYNLIENYAIFEKSPYYLRVDAGGKGEQFSYKWRIQPDSSILDFDVTFSIVDMSTNETINTKTVHFIVKDAKTSSTGKILIIGDSYVQDFKVSDHFYEFTQEDSNNFTMIGTRHSVNNTNVYDEGHSGWTISKFVTDVSSPFVFSGILDFSQYMTTHSFSGLQYVSILTGLNDSFWYENNDILKYVDGSMNNIQQMIDSIHAYNPNIKVLISVIIPPRPDNHCSGSGSLNHIWQKMKYNSEQYNLAILKTFQNRENENIYLIPIGTNFDTRYGIITSTVNNCDFGTTTEDVATDVHPTEIGSKQIAYTLYQRINSLM